jgi:hypothetical protein
MEWYHEECLLQSLQEYIKKQGYKIVKKGAFSNGEGRILVSRKGKQEMIEIKGTPSTAQVRRKNLLEATGPSELEHHKELLQHSLSRHPGGKVASAICVPDISYYREVVEKLKDYFTLNNLHMRIYLVRENGQVVEYALNARENAKTRFDVDVDSKPSDEA